MVSYRKKLIEVSLPLEAINKEAAREKSIRHGHPSTLHLWWARRPLAACRAVLFSSLVDDPSEYMPDEESAREERERLFRIIEDLVKWENSNNEEVLDKAKLEIARSVARNLGVPVPIGKEAIREFLATKAPPVLDPFAGGGSIPLEAQRLGLRAYASDLNPVAVLINKALIEIPPKFAGMPPVHPAENEQSLIEGKKKAKAKKKQAQPELWQREWKGAQGLAEDVRYYGKWMRDEAFKRIGHHYPPVLITKEMIAERLDLKEQGLKVGDKLTVIAWLWARTVKCPNPACGAQMPLARSFAVSTKKGREARVEYVVTQTDNIPQINFVVRVGKGKAPAGTVNRNGARCICCDTPVGFEYIREEGKAGRLGAQLMAIIAEGSRGRIYFSPSVEHETIAKESKPDWKPETDLPEKALGFRVQLYGMVQHADLFTSRQLVGLTTLSDLVKEARKELSAHSSDMKGINLENYADAVSIYLAMAVSRQSNRMSTICFWDTAGENVQQVFARQALPMTWDFAEANPFSNSSGSFHNGFDYICTNLDRLPLDVRPGHVVQNDASKSLPDVVSPVVSTDPPYYDNIGYADLSDYFYIWLRGALNKVIPNIFDTMLVPKAAELIATPFRFGDDKKKAEEFFETGLRHVFQNINEKVSGGYPVTIFYAFKQSESKDDDEWALGLDNENRISRISTGWETMLDGLLGSGFEIHGTWPMRTEQPGGLRVVGQNSLASSIVLVCRRRSESSTSTSRREFLSSLKKELSPALRELQQGSVAPVDLAQAAIGPGMAVFSRYDAVLEADGSPMSVRTALGLINQALDESLAEQEGEYDSDTRWALAWYEQFGHNEAAYGVAETLSTAKNTSVGGLEQAGILEARAGKVRLFRRDELDSDWDPAQDKRLTIWEAVQHLIYSLENGGEQVAADLLSKLGSVAEPARDLAYRLYTVCERKGWAQDALGYNSLVVAWPRLKELASQNKALQEQLL
jgi:putative DNA methylase